MTVGRASPAMMAFKRIAPGTYERTMAKKGRRDQFTDRPAATRSSGNLYRPMPEYDRTRGGWLDEERDSRSKGRTALLSLAAVAAVPLLVAYARR